MNGGTIMGITTIENGAAIRLNGAVFNMNGGAIVNNFAFGNDQYSGNGGAVSVYENSTFNMNGGRISHNSAGYRGGAFFLYNNQSTPSVLNISGGEIKENVCEGYGAGVYIGSRGRLDVSGTAVIKDNKIGEVDNNVFGNINVTGALQEGAKIGVTTYETVTESNDVIFTSNYSTYNSGDNPSDYFTSDVPGTRIVLKENGEAYVVHTTLVVGDIDHNDTFDIFDVRLLLQASINDISLLSEDEIFVCDLNDDKKVDILDVRILLQRVVTQ